MPMVRPDQAGAMPPKPESVEDLFQALESPLLTYALRLLPGADTAEDVVQEAFMRLHTHFAEVREPRSWLYRTVHNLALNHQRKASKIVPLDPGGAAAGDAPDPPNEPADAQPLPDEQI